MPTIIVIKSTNYIHYCLRVPFILICCYGTLIVRNLFIRVFCNHWYTKVISELLIWRLSNIWQVGRTLPSKYLSSTEDNLNIPNPILNSVSTDVYLWNPYLHNAILGISAFKWSQYGHFLLGILSKLFFCHSSLAEALHFIKWRRPMPQLEQNLSLLKKNRNTKHKSEINLRHWWQNL